jgi:formate hydrogenlyase subunit 3/multisubunit Na+/H+ antiporter MnhD subunit
MFLAVGQWQEAAGSDRLAAVRGLAGPMPMTAFAFALAAINLIGLPPSGGFTGKYLVMTAAFASGQWGWALVFAGGGLLSAVYLYRPMAALFAREPGAGVAPLSRGRQVVPLLLAVAAIALGLLSDPVFALLSIGRADPAGEGL